MVEYCIQADKLSRKIFKKIEKKDFGGIKVKEQGDLLFALDIGTRTVIGLY